MTFTLLRHSVSGVISAFPEDYAESLLEDPVLGKYLERTEEDAPCLDCPPRDEWDANMGDESIEEDDAEAYDTFLTSPDKDVD